MAWPDSVQSCVGVTDVQSAPEGTVWPLSLPDPLWRCSLNPGGQEDNTDAQFVV